MRAAFYLDFFTTTKDETMLKFSHTKKDLTARLTIRKGRKGRKGGKSNAIDAYIAASVRLADRRNPVAKNIDDARRLAKAGCEWRRNVGIDLASVEDRCTARCVSPTAVIVAVRTAALSGVGQSGNGGRPAGSCGYGYSYTLTSYTASPIDGGDVEYVVRRGGLIESGVVNRRVAIRTSQSDAILGGAIIAVQKSDDVYYCFDAELNLLHYAYRVTDRVVAAKYGAWEHAGSAKAAKAETQRKRTIIDADAVRRRQSEIAAAYAARTARRADRAAKLLARLSTKEVVTFADARSIGACEAGIRAFAERIGKPLDAAVSLAEIAAISPVWAIRLARRAIDARMAG